MDKQAFIEALEQFNLPKTEFIILSGGSLVMRGLRDTTADLDLAFSPKLAQRLHVDESPINAKGHHEPFENCEAILDYDNYQFDLVDGYQCEVLDSILALKKSRREPKDLKDIARIEEYLKKNA